MCSALLIASTLFSLLQLLLLLLLFGYFLLYRSCIHINSHTIIIQFNDINYNNSTSTLLPRTHCRNFLQTGASWWWTTQLQLRNYYITTQLLHISITITIHTINYNYVNTHAQDSLPRLLATRRHLLVD